MMLLFVLVSRAQNLGFLGIWQDHIAIIPWFGEWPGFGYGQMVYTQPMLYPQGYQQGMMQAPYYVPQYPGQSVMMPGLPPTIATM